MSSRAAPAELAAAAEREKAPSGRLLLRMPRTLHADLARAAEREGTSLNGFITGSLARTIGWRGEDGELPGVSSAPVGRRQTRILVAVLIANAVVVGLAALAAVGVLLLAWLG